MKKIIIVSLIIVIVLFVSIPVVMSIAKNEKSLIAFSYTKSDLSTVWSDTVTVDGKNIDVEMIFRTAFSHNDSEKIIKITAADYEYSASDGNADVYFSDVKIDSKYSNPFLWFPAKCTSILSFMCNGEPVTMRMYLNSNGNGSASE